jgi:hypothetical protein
MQCYLLEQICNHEIILTDLRAGAIEPYYTLLCCYLYEAAAAALLTYNTLVRDSFCELRAADTTCSSSTYKETKKYLQQFAH